MRKRLRRAAALALAAAALLALSGCASSQEERRGLDGGETSVILATSGEPLRFYALSEEGCAGDDNLVLSNVYDCLTFLEPDGSISPGLAESWEISEDGLCYTFHLRRGVRFHNGLEMTAEDVKFTYDKGAAGPLGAGLFVNYERCEIVDDYTVNIYLTAPYAGFLYGVASRLGGICCKAYYDEVGDEGYLKAPIGTGPYTLDEVINGEKIVLRANDGYWRGEPAIKEVTIAIVPNVSTQMIGLENGDYDAVRNPPIDSCLHLKEGGDVTWDYADSTGRITLYLAVWGGRPGEDLNFRLAVQCGIDKDEVNEGANSGCATILDIDMCPIYAGYPSEGLQAVAYDREKALDYLAASSCSGESFEILCQSGTACETVAKIIQSQLIELGIAATVTAVDSSSYTQLQLAGDYDAVIREQLSSMVDADGASTFFNTTPGYAYTKNCKYPRADEIFPLFVQGREAQGEEREPYYAEACNIITEEAYLVPLYNGLIAVACSTHLQGVEAHCLGTYNFYRWSWD